MVGVFFCSVGLCVLLYCLFISGVSYLVRFRFLSILGCYWLVKFDFDYVTFGVVVMLLICFFYVYYYTRHYFGGSFYTRCMLLKLVVLFVSVMGILVCTGDYLCTLIF